MITSYSEVPLEGLDSGPLLYSRTLTRGSVLSMLSIYGAWIASVSRLITMQLVLARHAPQENDIDDSFRNPLC